MMRRSFGDNRRMGGGGGMLRSTIRRVRAVGGGGGGGVNGGQSVNKPNSKATSNILSLSTGSSPSSVSACSSQKAYLSSCPSTCSNNNSNNGFCDSDIWDWETVDADGDGDDRLNDRTVFGPVPSQHEVEDAVSSFQHFLASASYAQIMGDTCTSNLDKDFVNETSSHSGSVQKDLSARTEHDWIEPSLFGTMMHPGFERGRVYDAFHLLQTDSTIQRAVISLSTDRAVWDAVLNNDVVKELRDAYEAENKEQIPDEKPAAVTNFLKWMLDNSKMKLMEFIDTVTKLFSEVFPASEMEKDRTEPKATTTVLHERLRSSLMLSIVVLLIVVVTRAHRV